MLGVARKEVHMEQMESSLGRAEARQYRTVSQERAEETVQSHYATPLRPSGKREAYTKALFIWPV